MTAVTWQRASTTHPNLLHKMFTIGRKLSNNTGLDLEIVSFSESADFYLQ
jgi:hypothetical protein